MNCDATAETQAAFNSDVAQVKATCGTWQILRALTLLSETILSYAEGNFTSPKAFDPRPSMQQAHNWMNADMGVFEKHAIEGSGDYLMELLQEIFQPGSVLSVQLHISRTFRSD